MSGGSSHDRRKDKRQGTPQTKKSSPAKKPSSENEEIAPRRRSLIVRAITSGWAVVSVILVLLSAFGTIAYFTPKIDLSVSESPFPNNPFLSKFQITNNGNFDLKQLSITSIGMDLHPYNSVDQAQTDRIIMLNTVGAHNTFQDVEALEPSASETFSSNLALFVGGEELSQSLELNGRLLMEVRFHYLFFPKHFTRYFVFKGYVDANHHTFWTKQPLDQEERKRLDKREEEDMKDNPDVKVLN